MHNARFFKERGLIKDVDNTVIDGKVFSALIKGALGELILYEKEIDDLNVFPVPDGDTGANMRRTLELGVQSAPETQKLNEYLDKLSTGMLFGARGNSGVILSQIFKGISIALQDKAGATAADILDAFSSGYITAYNTVLHPVEGTILTVLREGVERTKSANLQGVEEMLERLLAEMKVVLDETPELLPVLKEAGVVDSGGYGLVKIVEGMLATYRGEEIDYKPAIQSESTQIDTSAFDENSEFEFGYCMEFILQLQTAKTAVGEFSKEAYTEEISAYGNSIVAIREKSKVRVHIHTFVPETIIAISRKYGEFVFFKLENMSLQHNETVAEKSKRSTPHKDMEIISVVSGSTLSSLFSDLGCGIIVGANGDKGVSVQDFIDALELANADTVVILPNDKNDFQTATQAVKMYKNDKVKVEVVATNSIAEGYFALASDMPDLSAAERVDSIREGFNGVSTVCVCKCTRARTNNGISCSVGDFVALVNGKLVKSSTDLWECVEVAMKTVKDIDEREMALAFIGANLDADGIIEKIGEEFPSLQIEVIEQSFSEEKLVIGII